MVIYNGTCQGSFRSTRIICDFSMSVSNSRIEYENREKRSTSLFSIRWPDNCGGDTKIVSFVFKIEIANDDENINSEDLFCFF